MIACFGLSFEYEYTQDHPSKKKPKAFLVELQQIDK